MLALRSLISGPVNTLHDVSPAASTLDANLCWPSWVDLLSCFVRIQVRSHNELGLRKTISTTGIDYPMLGFFRGLVVASGGLSSITRGTGTARIREIFSEPERQRQYLVIDSLHKYLCVPAEWPLGAYRIAPTNSPTSSPSSTTT